MSGSIYQEFKFLFAFLRFVTSGVEAVRVKKYENVAKKAAMKNTVPFDGVILGRSVNAMYVFPPYARPESFTVTLSRKSE